MDADSPSESNAATEETKVGQEAAQLVNVEIRTATEAEVLAHGVLDEPYGFMCECGCMKMVELPLSVYDAEGAWVEGHKPE